jgi:hypothetical protein
MSKPIINPNLLDTVVTVHQAKNFIKHLDQLLKDLYTIGRDWDYLVRQHLSEEQLIIVQEALRDNGVSDTDSVKVETILTNLKQTIVQSSEISIYLAIDLPMTDLIFISRWFRENIGQAVTLDIHIDYSLLGGVVIKQAGVMRDYSLRKRLHQYFTGNPMPI